MIARLPGSPDTMPDLERMRDRLASDGYVIFDSGVEMATIDAAISKIEPLFSAETGLARSLRRAKRAVRGRHTAISHRDDRRVQDAWVVCDEVREIALAPAILELLQVAFGRTPRPFQTLNFRLGSEQRPHSDAMHFNSDPPGYMCGVWVALEDIGPEQGPLVYYPGSHRLPELTQGDLEAAAGGEHADYEEYVAGVIDREGLEARTASLRKGQALLWASNLIHGGAKQRDPQLTRWSQVTHYFFEGCRYWKPLETQGTRRYWQPTWVR